MQHPQCERDHLQILAARRGADVPRPSPDIEDDCPLQPWYQEMCALVDDLFLDSRQTVEDDGAGSALDVVEGALHDAGADGSRNDPAEEGGGYRSHGWRVVRVWCGEAAVGKMRRIVTSA
jgi:hypothetical protein